MERQEETNRVFQGRWITTADFCDLESVNVFHRQLEPLEIHTKGKQNSHILFRKWFQAETTEKVFLYISADDYYKLYINGRFVCQGPAPGYPFHYYYNTVNISPYLKKGENLLAVHTYYQGLINRVWVSGDDRHGLILDVEQEGRLLVCSDESFLCAYHSGFEAIGRFGYDTQFAERYVSGGRQEHFEQPDYDDAAWEQAKYRTHVDYTLVRQPSKMLAFEKILPKISRDDHGVTLDFGKTYVGYLCVAAKGKKNDEIELLFAQELSDDGTVRWKMRANCDYREAWVLSGKEDRLNEFDYKSFRYVRINLLEGCRITEVYLLARHYPFELKASPSVKDPALLRIWELCVNSLKYGAQEVIQDCMEREKGNYLGDGCYTALAHAVLTKDTSLFQKLMDDSLRSRFITPGLVTCAACSFMQEIAEYPLMMYYAFYAYYQLTGDTAYLARHYDQLCEILDEYKTAYGREDGLLSNLDKWCVVEWPKEYRDGYDADLTEGKINEEVHNVINAHYLGAIKYFNKIAKLLNRAPYSEEKGLLEAYYNAFYDRESRLFFDKIGSKHVSLLSNIFPLMYDLCPDRETEERIVALVEERGFTRVMLFGAFPILAGLKRMGKTDTMYQFLSDENAWLRMLREGATTTFEGWSAKSKWNTSLFHLTLSYAVLFLTDWERFS